MIDRDVMRDASGRWLQILTRLEVPTMVGLCLRSLVLRSSEPTVLAAGLSPETFDSQRPPVSAIGSGFETTPKILTLALMLLVGSRELFAQKQVFQAPGKNLGVWQLTDEPTQRNWANYHNCPCFSPDGRYVCYIGQPADKPVTVRVFDLAKNQETSIGHGTNPRWAKHHNWLFFSQNDLSRRTTEHLGTVTFMVDMDNAQRKTVMDVPGAEALGGTSFDDRWLIGAQRFRRQTPEFRYVRIRIPEGGFERLTEITGGSQLLPNPRHPLFFAREDHKSDPFEATRYFYDLDGTNRRIAVPTLQQCHMSWLGNGEYFLLGNGLVRGRKWNEPFPSNVHFLAGVSVGDISPCGASGRWVCGDSTLADLRCGDGWHTIEPLSMICFPSSIGDNSGIYDADPKGSPDGTKVCFVSNYPLRDGPLTHIVKARAGSLEVTSTDGFPEQGHLVVSREVIAYRRKTPTHFEGLQRQMFDTAGVNLGSGRTVTSFERRCMTEDEYKSLSRPHPAMSKSIDDPQSPLMRQRMTDVYVVIVRQPDRPWLREISGQGFESSIELIPGENHREIRGYQIHCNGVALTDEIIEPGTMLSLTRPGQYTAMAVEWSGLESNHSNSVHVDVSDVRVKLHVRQQPPHNFSWTTEHWTKGRDQLEVMHRYDGVIRREWYEDGVMTGRHNLNQDGKATRQAAFRNGQMTSREYYSPQDARISREVFDDAGFVTESIRYGAEGTDIDHWWYEQGWPVKHVRKGRQFVKHGDRWGYFDAGRFIDTPREQ